jgi:hypothetical protein
MRRKAAGAGVIKAGISKQRLDINTWQIPIKSKSKENHEHNTQATGGDRL